MGAAQKEIMEDISFKDAITYGHLLESADKCCKSVRWKASVQMFEIDRQRWVAELYESLINGAYRSKGFYEFWITERGKRRFIQSVHVSERCVQKCINEYGVKPYITPRLIYDNSASLPGKGTEWAIKRLRKHLATHYRKHGREGGVLLCDFQNYFVSIPHDRLLAMLDYAIRDKELFKLTKYFIDQFGDTGLGLGSELSQIAAIYYPNMLDHFIKERLHIRGYGRYMDDFYLIHEDVDHLRYCFGVIDEVSYAMGLNLNPKTQIVRLEGGSFTWLKRRFSLSETGKVITRLTRANITKRRRILKRQAKKGIDASKSYMSWRGYASKWNSGKTVHEMDRLYYELFGGKPWIKT